MADLTWFDGANKRRTPRSPARPHVRDGGCGPHVDDDLQPHAAAHHFAEAIGRGHPFTSRRGRCLHASTTPSVKFGCLTHFGGPTFPVRNHIARSGVAPVVHDRVHQTTTPILRGACRGRPSRHPLLLRSGRRGHPPLSSIKLIRGLPGDHPGDLPADLPRRLSPEPVALAGPIAGTMRRVQSRWLSGQSPWINQEPLD